MIRFSFVTHRINKLNDELHENVPFILEKINNYEGKKIILPDYIHERDFLFKKDIDKTVSTIKNIPNIDTTILDYNYANLTTSYHNREHCADYDIIDNHMRISTKDTINHEVFHLASSYYDNDKKMIISGFSLCDDDFMFGRAFTEGYTEMLTQKHFPQEEIPSYEMFVKYAKLFKNTFPNTNLDNFYFKADLKGMINELTNYDIPKEQIITYIYLLNRFTLFNTSIIEGYLEGYLEEWNEKSKQK